MDITEYENDVSSMTLIRKKDRKDNMWTLQKKRQQENTYSKLTLPSTYTLPKDKVSEWQKRNRADETTKDAAKSSGSSTDSDSGVFSRKVPSTHCNRLSKSKRSARAAGNGRLEVPGQDAEAEATGIRRVNSLDIRVSRKDKEGHNVSRAQLLEDLNQQSDNSDTSGCMI
eukprot:TRINITY_DN26297_c0_g1_i1.p1 TRINITY_DN26297_c0_g1~~TRINITY_DN26297_c0_g1_i1.p1  ORF type:complete len:170 (-),score=35.88 TRINITY_DN26297_c0_g1_i1:313-822(-)